MFRPGPVSGVAASVVGVLVLSTSAGASPGQDDPVTASRGPDVRISELANGGPGGGGDSFVELANFGDEPADLDGWSVYRCRDRSHRNSPGSPHAVLSDVTLAPGETYVIAHEGAQSTLHDVADELTSWHLHNEMFGIWLADDQRRMMDTVAVAPSTVISHCAPSSVIPSAPTQLPHRASHLPNNLSYRLGESHQRVATTGDFRVDFIKARRTPGAPNATEPDTGPQPSDVLISELTNGGLAGITDNFVEIANFGEHPVDVSRWNIYRCSRGGGDWPSGSPELATVPTGTVLDPGEVFVAAQRAVDVPDGVDHVRYSGSLEGLGFGVIIEDPDGNKLDSVGVYETDGVYQAAIDSPCTEGTALPNRLDYGFNETYQRFQNTGDNAADFVKASRTLGELVIQDPDDFPEPDPLEFGSVRISELAHSGPAGHGDTFFELGNYGDEPVSLSDWTVHRCAAPDGTGSFWSSDGRRVIEPLIESIGDVTLEPGETFLAVREGSPLHQEGRYDDVYTGDLSGRASGSGWLDVGFGLIVYDANGEVVDKTYANTLASAPVVYSPCTNEASVPNMIDTEGGESFQRLQSTGSNTRDFVPAPRTPGELNTDLRAPADFTEEELAPVDVPASPRPLPAALVRPEHGADTVGSEAELTVTAEHTTGDDVEVTFRGAQQVVINDRATRAFTGVSDQAPPAQRRPHGERPVRGHQLPLNGAGEPVVAEATEGFPYQRYQLVLDRIDGEEVEVVWSGRSTGRNELQLYVWNHREGAWELLDAAGGVTGGEITLIGTAEVASMVRGRRLEVLVQDGPGTQVPFSDEDDEPNLAFKDPDEYDLSVGFLADTQNLSQRFRRTYAEMNRWLVTNQNGRKIDYTFHVGDIIQKWTGDQIDAIARDEFELASDAMQILEDASHPYGVIPGNHDNASGRSNDLYNEFFGPDRFEGRPWFGDAWEPDDNQNHYDVIESGGAKFLMVYLGYFGTVDGDPAAAISWANQVIANHPDHNVIIATHYYLNPDGSLASSEDGWGRQADLFWNELILPNENVFMVLAGHVQAVALNIKRDVGGVEGRTVIEMVADYAAHVKDDLQNTGFLRLLQVDVDAKTMAVNSYSPTLDEHNAWEYDRFTPSRYDDSDDEFTIDVDINDSYDKRVETDLIGVLMPVDEIGTVDAAAGDDATVTWNDLSPGTSYGWYTQARDASGAVARSPIWTFTTRR